MDNFDLLNKKIEFKFLVYKRIDFKIEIINSIIHLGFVCILQDVNFFVLSILFYLVFVY